MFLAPFLAVLSVAFVVTLVWFFVLFYRWLAERAEPEVERPVWDPSAEEPAMVVTDPLRTRPFASVPPITEELEVVELGGDPKVGRLGVPPPSRPSPRGVLDALQDGPLSLDDLTDLLGWDRDLVYRELAAHLTAPPDRRAVDFVTRDPGNPVFGLVGEPPAPAT